MRWSQMLTVVDAHAEGEVGRVITGGVMGVPGASMCDKLRQLPGRPVRAGRPRARAELRPAHRHALEIDGMDTLAVDIAYGGDWFCVVDAPSCGFAVRRDEVHQVVELAD